MRALFCITLFAFAAAAGDPWQSFKEGTFEDGYWGVSYSAPGLKEGSSAARSPLKIFDGKCDGDVVVEIVLLPERAMKASERKEAWKADRAAKKKEAQDAQEGDDPAPWIVFAEQSLAGFNRHHGYAWYARGMHCFELHAFVQEKSETSGAAIAAALKGLKVGEDRNDCALNVMFAAKQSGKPLDDPQVLIMAGFAYTYNEQQEQMPQLAIPLLRRGLAKSEGLDAQVRWRGQDALGMSLLVARKLDEAVVELKKSEEQARAGGLPWWVPCYNLACAESLAGKLDDAFASLERALGAPERVVDDEHLSSDPDLENMRKDARWEKFWRTVVKKEKPAGQ